VPVSPARPAYAGEDLLVYLTGLGKVKEGAQPLGDGVVPVNASVSLSFSGLNLEIRHAGLVAGTAGLYQLVFTIPSSFSDGQYWIQVTADKVASNKSSFPVIGLPELSSGSHLH
jgi:uncharacterized protein (TIGR03437 family)